MQDFDFSDKRKYRRVQASIPVIYSVMATADNNYIERPVKKCETSDISLGGIQMVTDEEVESVDRLLRVEFKIKGINIRIIANIIWTKFDDSVKKYRSGIEFMMIRDDDMHTLREFVGS